MCYGADLYGPLNRARGTYSERRNKRESSSNTDFKIAIFLINATFRKTFSSFDYLKEKNKSSENRKSKIQERET